MIEWLYSLKFHFSPIHVPQIKEKMCGLSSGHRELKDGWEEQRVELEHNLDSQMFKRDAEQAEIWIAMRESLLGSDDIGVCMYVCKMYVMI